MNEGASTEAVIASLAPAVAKLKDILPRRSSGVVHHRDPYYGSVRSFSRIYLVLSVVPMSLIGVMAALLLFKKPVGFVAILGILALLRMIARNAIIRIDQIAPLRRAQVDANDFEPTLSDGLAFARVIPSKTVSLNEQVLFRNEGRASPGTLDEACIQRFSSFHRSRRAASRVKPGALG